MPEWADIATLAVASVSMIIAAVAFLRSGRRLDVEDAKKLENRLSAIETIVGALPGQAEVARMVVEEARLSGRIDTLATQLEAWKAVVNEQVGSVRSSVERVDNVVGRLEDLHLRGDV